MTEEYKKNAIKIGIAVAVLLGIFLIIESVYTYKQAQSLQVNTTITVSGIGKIEKAPDTARVSFNIEETKKTLADSQKIISDKVDAITKALGTVGIAKEAIKTDSYSTYPEYTYPQNICITYPCVQPAPILKGYRVAHAITIEIKDLAKIEEVLGTLGEQKVTNITGPNLGFADDKAVAREARDLAIQDAQKEAQKLAKALGVKLGKVVSFGENGNGGYYPMALGARADMAPAMAMQKAEVSIPQGNQKVESSVSITYEIR